ncbi:ABC transporter ATP-binding protein [Labrenzia sp. 011]|uniref:ABC transporter ATP-binding protein n=1 Tax=Labrenzia sp. 011 TaxID=2171494 RepID=UPI000D51EEEF|nr:ABC transporter ATP-binding protein [Labrenzia sp. 011]PVB60585.1 spermidine/putrescine ABC transporter ATP-binding protein [Labrenzia sp. 011]
MNLSFSNVVKAYGATRVVDDVSLDIPPSQFCSLLGPSGCGKTTLLRIAAGFVAADAGDVSIGGRSALKLRPNQRDVGFVFQSYALFPTKTVAQNIGFALSLQRQPRQRIRAEIEHLCAIMQLEGLEDRYPHELSGGQQQRVALARALISKPSILMLDEPLSALDAKIRAHLRVEIRRIVDTLGITTIYVTHDQEEALAISDRIAVMRGGCVVQASAPMDLYLNPADPFVARFVGTTNMLPCSYIGEARAELGGISIAVASSGSCPVGAATLSIRPEHIICRPTADRRQENDETSIPAILRDVSFLGPTVRLLLSTLGDRMLLVDMPMIDWLGRPVEAGSAVRWAPRGAFARVFAGSHVEEQVA